MRKTCERTGKTFIAKSNRQKYCKSRLCGYCSLRPAKESKKIDLVEIMEELTWEYERDDINEFHLRNENISNGLQDDSFWGIGNMLQDTRIKPRLLEGDVRAKKNVIHIALKSMTDLVIGKIEHRTNANQFCKSKLKYVDYFVTVETGQYTSTSVKIPYHLAIGLINNTQ